MIKIVFEKSNELKKMIDKIISLKKLILKKKISNLIILFNESNDSYVIDQNWIIDESTSLQMRTWIWNSCKDIFDQTRKSYK